MIFFVDDLTDAQRSAAWQWIEALCDDGHRQGRGALRSRDAEGRISYCCLGLACTLHSPQNWKPADDPNETGVSRIDRHLGDSAIYLSSEVREWLGLRDESGCALVRGHSAFDETPQGQHRSFISLAGLNDATVPFSTIADLLADDLNPEVDDDTLRGRLIQIERAYTL
ncbi:MAG: hypothetical protein ACPGNP_11005 [Acidimicrobiales bacterium]